MENKPILFDSIEFVLIERTPGRGRGSSLLKNIVSIRRRNECNSPNNYVRFSPHLVDELTPYDSVKLAKNIISGEIYFVFFKGGEGDIPFRLENSHSGRNGRLIYPVIQGRPFVNILLKLLGEPVGDTLIRVEISDNLSKSESFRTYMITKKL